LVATKHFGLREKLLQAEAVFARFDALSAGRSAREPRGGAILDAGATRIDSVRLVITTP
jgi:hypothetical protein